MIGKKKEKKRKEQKRTKKKESTYSVFAFVHRPNSDGTVPWNIPPDIYLHWTTRKQ